MLLIYVAIALFALVIIWLALQPKQGTKASNAPDPDDVSYQLPKPQELSSRPEASPPSPRRDALSQVSYKRSISDVEPVNVKDIDSPEIKGQIKSLMQQNRKIDAIRLVRTTTGWSLKQTKDYVELLDSDFSRLETAEPPDINDQVRLLMQQNRKIDAIKLVRATTGWGLKQSKDYLDAFPNLDPLVIKAKPTVSDSNPAVVETFDIDRHDINDRVRLFMQQNRKIDAIKLVKAVTDWSLKEAKDYIDRYPDISPLPIAERGPVSSRIQQLLSEKKYMDAIHLVENRTGMMLLEAKDYIEQTFDCTFPF